MILQQRRFSVDSIDFALMLRACWKVIATVMAFQYDSNMCYQQY